MIPQGMIYDRMGCSFRWKGSIQSHVPEELKIIEHKLYYLNHHFGKEIIQGKELINGIEGGEYMSQVIFIEGPIKNKNQLEFEIK